MSYTASIIWLIVAVLVLAWLRGLDRILQFAATVPRVLLIVAVVLALIAFPAAGYYVR